MGSLFLRIAQVSKSLLEIGPDGVEIQPIHSKRLAVCFAKLGAMKLRQTSTDFLRPLAPPFMALSA